MKKSFLAIVVVLSPIKAALAAAFGLVVADLITGIMAAKKQNKPITSSGLKSTVIKLTVYQLAIILAFIVEKYLVQGMALTNIVTSYVGLTELLSINENIEVISGTNLLEGIINKFKTLQK